VLPPETFDRMDDTPDGDFYRVPRLVAHIDPGTIEALTAYYAEALADADAVLDLMSSWISHLPAMPRFSRVAGLGMNEVELAANSRLSERVVHDLNADPRLPFESGSFDAVLNAVSVQYLTRPVEVFAEVARVLRPGGLSIVAMSHRCFPTKAIRAFHVLPRDGRLDLVSRYHAMAGGFDPAECIDRSPANADPLWIVAARRLQSPADSSEET
jgi:SAM-dependent methyltransferase